MKKLDLHKLKDELFSLLIEFDAHVQEKKLLHDKKFQVVSKGLYSLVCVLDDALEVPPQVKRERPRTNVPYLKLVIGGKR